MSQIQQASANLQQAVEKFLNWRGEILFFP